MENDDLEHLRLLDERKRNNISLMYFVSKKIYSLTLCLVFFSLSILIVVFSRELGALRGFLWDVVIVMLLLSILQVCIPVKPWIWVLSVLSLAYSIEILQYFHLIEKLSLEKNIFAELILGSVFDPLDLIAYLIGGILIFLLDTYFSPEENPRSRV